MKCTEIFWWGNKKYLKCLLPVLFGMLVLWQPVDGQKPINFNNLNDSGIIVWKDYQGVPDNKGVFETSTIQLPEITKGIYYSCGWWPTGSNRVYGNIFDNVKDSLGEGGIFMLMKLSDGRYLSILPLASKQAYSWLDFDGNGIKLKTGNHGRARFYGDLPVLSWAFAVDPYQACRRAWQQALESPHLPDVTKLRFEKKYPEPFEYLGWCSWEQYHKDISEDKMVEIIKEIENSVVPVRTFLIDGGHFDPSSLQPNDKFPTYYKQITQLKKENKIRWMGIWYAFLGEQAGVKIPNKLDFPSNHLITVHNKVNLPKPEEHSIELFYDYLTIPGQQAGFDFVKVDFQTDALTLYAGGQIPPVKGLSETNADAVNNPTEAAVDLESDFQKYIEKHFDGLINCNWHNSQCLFYSGNSVVGRCSEDYKLGDKEKARQHLYHSYTSIPWLGQIVWGDHDMFHSNDKFAGEMMAISKALSGGPVFLSDAPSDFKPEIIRPLAFKNGKLLRPVAPASPFPDDLFKGIDDRGLFRVMSPLNDNSVSVVVYNFSAGINGAPQKQFCKLSPADYPKMTGMIQPAVSWEIPEEGLVIYDWQKKSSTVFDNEIILGLEGFNNSLFQISPINKGWAVIGRTDKYLPAAAVKILSVTKEKVSMFVEEAGPIGVFCKMGTPMAKGFQIKALGGDFFELIPESNETEINQTVIITIK